jgi:hypothetical protein
VQLINLKRTHFFQLLPRGLAPCRAVTLPHFLLVQVHVHQVNGADCEHVVLVLLVWGGGGIENPFCFVAGDCEHVLEVVDVDVDEGVDDQDAGAVVVVGREGVGDHDDEDGEDEGAGEGHEEGTAPRPALGGHAATDEAGSDVYHPREHHQSDHHPRHRVVATELVGHQRSVVHLLHRVHHQAHDQQRPHHPHVRHLLLRQLHRRQLSVLEVDAVGRHQPQKEEEGDEVDHEEEGEEGAEWTGGYLTPLGLSTVMG